MATANSTARPTAIRASGSFLDAKVTEPDPASVRKSAGLSPQEMADLLGMGLNGYMLWEKGARRPGGPALQLLKLIDNDPQRVIAALK